MVALLARRGRAGFGSDRGGAGGALPAVLGPGGGLLFSDTPVWVGATRVVHGIVGRGADGAGWWARRGGTRDRVGGPSRRADGRALAACGAARHRRPLAARTGPLLARPGRRGGQPRPRDRHQPGRPPPLRHPAPAGRAVVPG